MVDLIDKGLRTLWQKLVAREQIINNVICAYAIITSFKKNYTHNYISLSDANTNVFIVFFTASCQLVNVSCDHFFAGGLALLACFAGGILRLDVG